MARFKRTENDAIAEGLSIQAWARQNGDPRVPSVAFELSQTIHRDVFGDVEDVKVNGHIADPTSLNGARSFAAELARDVEPKFIVRTARPE